MQAAPNHFPIPVVLHQHAEESAILRNIRSVLVRAPHVELHRLRRLDERLFAHLDGLSVAGEFGTQLCTQALERPGAGEVFAATLRAIDERNAVALNRIVMLAQALPDARRGLLSALGWASAADLKGIIRTLLESVDPFRRTLAIATCRLHRADPGPALPAALRHDDTTLRAEALRTAGEIGRVDLLAQIQGAFGDADEHVAARAAIAACLLGDRADALVALHAAATGAGPLRDAATQCLLLASNFEHGRQFVATLARRDASGADPDAALKRRVIRSCGLLGDPQYVGWLISLMSDDAYARIAGEAFTLITGADLAKLDLERKPPDAAPAGPTEEAADDDVALDEDDSLPWPDAALVQRWWQANAAQLPVGTRCFMGAEVDAEHATQVLRKGAQRQRFVAAQHLVLLSPGTSLFPVCAPAHRQARLLGNVH